MEPADIAFVGGGPAALVAAIALARRGIRTTVFERDAHPEVAPRFNPDRSYTIDISGHGLRALRHIEATPYFDYKLIQFKGIKMMDQGTAQWTLPGWTGSRGDILRALMALAEEKYSDRITFEFECRVNAVDVRAGTLTYAPQSGESAEKRFDFITGADGAGSVVRNAMLQQVEEFTVKKKSFPNYCTVFELDLVGDQLDQNYLHGLSVHPFCVAGAIKGEHGPDTARWFCAVGTKKKMAFSSADDARRFFRERCPRILELASEEAVAAFAKRTCYHIGQKLTCSQLHGGKAVLIGDAAGPFPPIGQGVNAAMESADGSRPLHRPGRLLTGAAHRSRQPLQLQVEARGGCGLLDQRKESLREPLPRASHADHHEAWLARSRASQERGRPLLGGKAQGRAALAAVRVLSATHQGSISTRNRGF